MRRPQPHSERPPRLRQADNASAIEHRDTHLGRGAAWCRSAPSRRRFRREACQRRRSRTAPILIDLTSIQTATITIGALISLLGLATWRAFTRLDRDAPAPSHTLLERLRTDPIFSPLSQPALEQLARATTTHRYPAGSVIFHQGQPGDAYYLITTGSVTVHTDGVQINTLATGDGFGETALLTNAPRNATITTHTETTLLAVPRDAFLTTLTTNPQSHHAATTIATTRTPHTARLR